MNELEKRHDGCILLIMSRCHNQWGKNEIAEAVLAYLADHPDAQDTLKGISEWWLAERKIIHLESLLEQVLRELVSKTRLIEVRKANDVYYALNRAGYQSKGLRRRT